MKNVFGGGIAQLNKMDYQNHFLLHCDLTTISNCIALYFNRDHIVRSA